MELYPPGHRPFLPLLPIPHAETPPQLMPKETSPVECLLSAQAHLHMAQMFLEVVRGYIFRSMQLAEAEPLPAELGTLSQIPRHVRVLLQTMDASRQCLEEWMESAMYLDIVKRSNQRAPS